MSGSLGKEKVVGEKQILGKSKWLQLVDVKYVRDGQERTWQYCERCTRPANCDVDAVTVFAIVREPSKPSRVVVVKQFRPPLNTYTVELCAGLVDPGETVELRNCFGALTSKFTLLFERIWKFPLQAAALRELKEETGYTGKVLFTGGKQYLSPGLTNECVKTVFCEVDASKQTRQDKEDEGAITVELLPLDGLLETLNKLEGEGYAVWVGLYSIAQTLKLQSILA
eukprot:CAMPEP_0177593452 /NCGR_PEP_ID=MMETSP0419_2-20121207/9157_1 /TAXON_ID=582737 /ORGANISM="Tetraselmis sp., Strain GSL018" /LENGTH=225 /DNA_ID=CAMNT_0019084499 /DNA_START=106 /DNA_END=784 /DNA_ORIENTATION=+